MVAVAIFTISWTESKKSVDDPQWYAVNDTGSMPGTPANQQISPIPLDEEPTGECNDLPGTICAVLLDLDNNPVPATIADANTQGFNTSTRKHTQE